MIVLDEKARDRQWNGFTLILPAVSVGNVGQLSVDLLLTALKAVKIGSIFHDSVLPVVGTDPYGNNVELVTACDLYVSEKSKLVILQQRAPFVISNKRAEFRDRLLDWSSAAGFSKIVVLTSSFAHERIDSQLQGSPFRYLSTKQLSAADSKSIEDLKWTRLEPRSRFPAPSAAEESWKNREEKPEGNGFDWNLMERNLENNGFDPNNVYLPGGGMAKKLYECCYTRSVPLAILLVFCGEGDNTGDAMLLADHVKAWLQIVDSAKGWQCPVSWKCLFGSGIPDNLF